MESPMQDGIDKRKTLEYCRQHRRCLGEVERQSPCDNCIVNGPGFIICGWC